MIDFSRGLKLLEKSEVRQQYFRKVFDSRRHVLIIDTGDFVYSEPHPMKITFLHMYRNTGFYLGSCVYTRALCIGDIHD